jgi:hypothetical protein
MPRQKIYSNNAEKMAASRSRNKTINVCVELPALLSNDLDIFLVAKNLSKKKLIASLISDFIYKNSIS